MKIHLVRIILILNTAVQRKVKCLHRNYSCSISSVKIPLFPFYFLFLLATFFVISSPKRFMFEYRITYTIRFIHPMLGEQKESTFMIMKTREENSNIHQSLYKTRNRWQKKSQFDLLIYVPRKYVLLFQI